MLHAWAASLFDFKERLVDPYILLTKFRASGGKCMCVVHGSHADQHKLRRSLVRCCDEFLLANNAIVGPRPAGCLVSQLTEKPSSNVRRSRRTIEQPSRHAWSDQWCAAKLHGGIPAVPASLTVDVPVSTYVTGSATQTRLQRKQSAELLRRFAPRNDELRRLRGTFWGPLARSRISLRQS